MRVILAAILFFLFPWPVARAAPLPPRIAVDHEAKTCARFFAGDECMDCFPPEGWEILDLDAECPPGYSMVDDLDPVCKPFKASFCCSEGHSGAHGDCDDLVLNDKAKQCAFVDDIQACKLPSPWRQKAGGLAPRDWFCPSGYNWVEDVACVQEGGGEAQGGSEPQAETDRLPCLGLALLGPVLAAALLQKPGLPHKSRF